MWAKTEKDQRKATGTQKKKRDKSRQSVSRTKRKWLNQQANEVTS